MAETHGRPFDGGRVVWLTERLWRLAEGLPVTRVPIASITEFDRDCWFHGVAPSGRQVAEHARRIERADLRHPVILSADGGLMDGGHRIARAWIDGHTEIAAVRFEIDPEPDSIEYDEPAGEEDQTREVHQVRESRMR